jgi:hypothetical protein
VALKEHDVLKLNVDLLNDAGDAWTDEKIRLRTNTLVQDVLSVWPVPPGHKSAFAAAEERTRQKVGLADLIGAGLLEPGSVVYARQKGHSGRTATVLPDGRLDVDGRVFESPSGAARSITGKSVNGWWFFVVSPGSRRSFTDLFQEYVDQTSADVDQGEEIEQEEEEDSPTPE